MTELDYFVSRVIQHAKTNWEGAEPLVGELEQRARLLATDQAQLYVLQILGAGQSGAAVEDETELIATAMEARVANLRSAGEGIVVDTIARSVGQVTLEAIAFVTGLIVPPGA